MLLAGAGIGDRDFQIELALGLGFTRFGLILVFDTPRSDSFSFALAGAHRWHFLKWDLAGMA